MGDDFVFECPTCHAAVTLPLVPMATDDIGTDDGLPAVPRGFFALSDDEYWTGSKGSPVINLLDLYETKYHPDLQRHNGCCGRDGPNLLCRNGHEVGTERSDCWMSHGAVLVPAVIRRITG